MTAIERLMLIINFPELKTKLEALFYNLIFVQTLESNLLSKSMRISNKKELDSKIPKASVYRIEEI